eukprot:PhF_6_TR8244/c0_g1_i1/m.12547
MNGSCLVEEAKDLTTSVALAGLFVVHDAQGGGEDQEAELTGGQEGGDPFLVVLRGDIVAGADDADLVEATVQVDDDLTAAVVINDFEVTNVTVLLHDLEELDDDLGGGADQNLALSAALGAGDVSERVVQRGHERHG